MNKKMMIAVASLALSLASGCVSAPNAANALTPDKAGCRKDAQPGDYVACLQLMAQQPRQQGGGFAAGGNSGPAPVSTEAPADQASAPPPGGMPMGPGMMPGGPMGPGFGGGAPIGAGINIALACNQDNRRFQMNFYNVRGRAAVPRGPWVMCTDPRRLITIAIDGVAVPAIPPGAQVVLAGALPAMCYTQAGYGNHACRVVDAEFDAYTLEQVAAAGLPASPNGPVLTAFWVGKWRPPVPYRFELGAEAFVPHGGLPHQGNFTPNERSFGRAAELRLLEVPQHADQGEALKKFLPESVS